MDELKLFYNIELNEVDMLIEILGILTQKLNEVNKLLDMVSNKEQRITLLQLKKSLNWIIPILAKGELINEDSINN